MAQKRTHMENEDIPTSQECTGTSLKGYIHEVSPVKKSRNNNPYFKAKFQLRDEILPVICYSPQKRTSFLNAQTLMSPVKMTNIRLSPGKFSTDIHANYQSGIETLTESLPFTRRLTLPESKNDATDTTITEVKLQEMNPVKKYNIKGKVVVKQPKCMNNIHGTKKQVQTITLHDGLDYIDVILYEQLIDKVELNQSYLVCNLKLRFYSSIKLTTTLETTIEQIEKKFDIPSDFISDEQSQLRPGAILTARLCIKVKCPACYKNISCPVTTDTLFTCTSCDTRMKKTALSLNSTANLQIQFAESTEKLTAFHDTILTFLQTVNKQMLISNKTALEDYLLSDIKLFFQYNSSQIISKISINND